MFWSKAFIPTLKEAPQDAEAISHKLLFRAGMIRMLTSGVYIYLPLGLMVLDRIESIIREEMNAAGAQELLLSCIQPLELWKKTGRDEQLADIMIRFEDRRGRNLCLGPTHEEVITELVKNHVNSYRQLPVVLYQIQTKFRDEIRPRFGLIRACEFVMKDAYSFDRDQKGLEKNYEAMFTAYKNIFMRCGIKFLITEADSGVMGGSVSHEFMVPAQSGEDIVLFCKKCNFVKTLTEDKQENCPRCNTALEKKQTIEVGHVFQLGTKYSKALGANFLDEKGQQQTIIMGCYGIGVSRLISAIIEQNNDEDGIIWPREISPFDVLVLPVQSSNKEVMDLAKKYYSELVKKGAKVLLDDREGTAGVKFKDADLIGIPLRINIGEKNLQNGKVEISLRREKKINLVDKNKVVSEIMNLLKKGA
ncbi:MAG TPA: proline--tRNA ligase [Candidatus Omnitrophota bacterium]|nr:proline--tRNA ligase [Candidatus Omnitrophota bacterium]